MDFWLWALAQLLLLLTLVYIYLKQKYSYWSIRGVAGPKPWPIVGNLVESMLRGDVQTMLEWHQKYGPMYGTFQGLQPVLNIVDLNLIKQVMIKDFSAFVNRRKGVVLHELDVHNLFHLENEDWKRVRAITSPTFTSGKLRGMSSMMSLCVDKLTNYFDKITSNSQNCAEINTKVVMTGFTIDVIATTSFATETNANDDRSSANPFVVQANKMFNFSVLKIATILLIPRSVIRVYEKFIPPSSDDTFFYDLARQLIKQRKEENGSTKRNDFVQLLMNAKVEESELSRSSFECLTASVDKQEQDNNNNNPPLSIDKKVKTLSDIEIEASSVLFFLAGFETTASTLTHCLFELATNQDVQDRLHRELSQALTSLEPHTSQYYETVMTAIPYLDSTVKETLRKYPPLAHMERRVGTDGYKLNHLTLDKDQLICISAYAVHHNPEYYPEPERFNPERFMPENAHLFKPYTYMPFGHGPRNCVGMRFAYQEIKMCLAAIVANFQFYPTEGTPKVLELGKFALATAKTFPLKVVKREN